MMDFVKGHLVAAVPAAATTYAMTFVDLDWSWETPSSPAGAAVCEYWEAYNMSEWAPWFITFAALWLFMPLFGTMSGLFYKSPARPAPHALVKMALAFTWLFIYSKKVR